MSALGLPSVLSLYHSAVPEGQAVVLLLNWPQFKSVFFYTCTHLFSLFVRVLCTCVFFLSVCLNVRAKTVIQHSDRKQPCIKSDAWGWVGWCMFNMIQGVQNCSYSNLKHKKVHKVFLLCLYCAWCCLYRYVIMYLCEHFCSYTHALHVYAWVYLYVLMCSCIKSLLCECVEWEGEWGRIE